MARSSNKPRPAVPAPRLGTAFESGPVKSQRTATGSIATLGRVSRRPSCPGAIPQTPLATLYTPAEQTRRIDPQDTRFVCQRSPRRRRGGHPTVERHGMISARYLLAQAR